MFVTRPALKHQHLKFIININPEMVPQHFFLIKRHSVKKLSIKIKIKEIPAWSLPTHLYKNNTVSPNMRHNICYVSSLIFCVSL